RMSQAAKAQEPSMEEILASIRRIIADDDTKPAARPEAKAPEPKAPPPPPPKPAPAPPPAAAMKQDDIDAMLAGLDEPAAPEPPPPEPEPEPEVLELTEAMQAPASPAFRKIDAEQDVVFEEAPEPEPPRPPPRAPEPQPRMAQPAMPEAAIMSSSTAAAVDSAFNALAHTVLV